MRSYQRLDTQTRRKGQFCGFVLTLRPRLCAFLNKGIFDSRLNYNSYCLLLTYNYLEHVKTSTEKETATNTYKTKYHCEEGTNTKKTNI